MNAWELARVLRYEGANIRQLADALYDGLGSSFTTTARAIWQSGIGTNARELASVLTNKGASFYTTISALLGLAYWDANWIVRRL